MRQRCSLDSGWKFIKADIVDAERYSFDDGDWEEVRVPHDFSIEGPFDPDNVIWTGFLPKGTGWYRRLISIDDLQPDRKYFVEFEGVFRNSTVYMNGEMLGKHKYGYTGFIYDITPHLYADRPNVLALKIDDSNLGKENNEGREGWWYEGCGIYRNVWLISTGSLHVDKWGTFVTTPQVSEAEATVHVKTTLRNSSERALYGILETDIVDAAGHVIAGLRAGVLVAPGESKDIDQDTVVINPALWSPETPTLYRVETRMMTEGSLSDTYTTPFGIRWYEFTSDRGFFLNGKHVQLRGMCVHHDYGGLGVALPDRANYKTVEIMKEMGCNFLRSAHNDASPSLMDACDSLGMLVWAETRYLSAIDDSGPPLRDLIQRNRNHPGIICWGLANTAGSEDDAWTQFLMAMNAVARNEDPTRPTAFGCEANTDANANGFAFITDIMGYNGGGMGIDDRDHAAYPERKMLISEFSSGRGARGVYQEIEAEDADSLMLGDGRTIELTGLYLSIYDLCTQFETEWTHIAERPWLAGGAMWSGIEYWGETCGWPVVTSQFGVLDLCRFPKDTYYYFLQEWTSKPMVHIFPHWTWPGKEGTVINVWCYSNCDQVELFLNGESLGVKDKRPLGHIEWEVPYQPGTISARGLIKDELVCTAEHKTAGESARLEISADRTVIEPDNRDVSFVTVSILDEEGTFVPTGNNEIEVSVSGAGRLIGLGSGDPRSHESPKVSRMKAFNGLLLTVVQSNGQSGDIVVSASSKSCGATSLTFSASD